jgi:uncharacterized protein with von Willebrand factor type A (vWA) domain
VGAQPLQAIAGFAAHLREHGFAVGAGEQLAMVQVALAVGAGERQRLQAGWRAIACRDPADWRRYPPLFDAYWLKGRSKAGMRVGAAATPRRDLRQIVADLQSSMQDRAGPSMPAALDLAEDAPALQDGPLARSEREHAQGGASRSASPRGPGEGAPAALVDAGRIDRAVEAIGRRLRRQLTRAMRCDAHGRRLDLRRTLRNSLRTGGEPFKPVWRRPRRERPRLYLLVDVSRSMETYARMFLRVARAFVGVLDARAFVFHTRLAEVTAMLARDNGRMRDKIEAVTAALGGGTRIGSCVGEFARRYVRHGLTRRARVLILSDGFDSDPPGELASALRVARRHGARICWLHPTRAAPESAALAPCAGLIDRYAPLFDLDSLARVGALLD